MATENGYLIGSETIFTSNIIPQPYVGFKFNGNCIIDSIMIRNYTQTDKQILSDSVTIGVEPDWTPDVLFLASMNHTVDASNITGMTVMPTKWSLYRHEINGDVLRKVCDVDMSIQSWIDYKVESGGKRYEYYLYAENDEQISSPVITDEIQPQFYGYFLIDCVKADSNNPLDNEMTDVFMFDLNLTQDKVTVNNDFTSLKTYNRFDQTVIGNRNFKTSGFTSLLMPKTEIGEYDFEGQTVWAEFLDKLQVFLHNKQMKYLKDTTGKILKVTTEGSNSTFDYQLGNVDVNGQQIMNVSVVWQEIADVYDDNI
jgi:hypothetical protein